MTSDVPHSITSHQLVELRHFLARTPELDGGEMEALRRRVVLVVAYGYDARISETDWEAIRSA